MIEKDNIQELFSKAFENQTSAVRPELWTGLQAKMAAAGVASTATVATKGLSALTKWIIGSAAVGTVGVVTTVVALNSGEEQTSKQADSPKEISQNMTVKSPEKEKTGKETFHPQMGYSEPVVIKEEPVTNIPRSAEPNSKELKEVPATLRHENQLPQSTTPVKSKPEEKVVSGTDAAKKDPSEKTEYKKPVERNEPKETPAAKHPENTAEPVFADLKAEVTDFPNIFTPNGDGINDFYKVTVANIEDFNLIIISNSANSNTIFKTNDPNEGWDGTISGDRAPDGMYAAIVTGKHKNGKSFRDIQLFELKR